MRERETSQIERKTSHEREDDKPREGERETSYLREIERQDIRERQAMR